jgi:hypothetical protein
MRNSGFKMDMSGIRRKQKELAAIPARIFKPEISNYLLRPSLNKAKAATPVRELALIHFNQIEKETSQFNQWSGQVGSKFKRNTYKGVTRSNFLADRAPARFLFQLQWVQVGYSLGVNVTASAAVLSATTRNHDEPDIPQGRGQWHGGQTKLTASISVPFLDEPERKYKPFTGQGILTPIMAAQFPVFNRACERKMKRAVAAIARS